jgi:hypothetical protein
MPTSKSVSFDVHRTRFRVYESSNSGRIISRNTGDFLRWILLSKKDFGSSGFIMKSLHVRALSALT